jgi:hypothetical protein
MTHMPVISVFGRLRQKRIEASLGYIARHCLKKKKNPSQNQNDP